MLSRVVTLLTLALVAPLLASARPAPPPLRVALPAAATGRQLTDRLNALRPKRVDQCWIVAHGAVPGTRSLVVAVGKEKRRWGLLCAALPESALEDRSLLVRVTYADPKTRKPVFAAHLVGQPGRHGVATKELWGSNGGKATELLKDLDAMAGKDDVIVIVGLLSRDGVASFDLEVVPETPETP